MSCTILRWRIGFGRVIVRCISVASAVGVEGALLIPIIVTDGPLLVAIVRIL